MNSKSILAGAVATVIAGSTVAAPVSSNAVKSKQIQASVVSGVMAGMVQTINSPECTINPWNPHLQATSENA